ncbi:MAG TPA: hypothetical protein PK076_06100 [Saprospiraceae bacterium]|nr:hypothetical protein [Saprospiraceae bacterium]
MTKPFIQKSLSKPSLIQRLMKKKLTENFLIEVNNLLSTKEIISIYRDDIELLITSYGGKLSNEALNGLYSLYSDYLIFCLSDKVFSSEEIDELKHLKDIFALNDVQVKNIYNDITGKIYQKSVREVVDDGIISTEEQNFLAVLQQNLLLPDILADELAQEVKGNFVKDYVKGAVSDERLSPLEEEQLALICKSLDVNLTYSEATKAQLNKYKIYWTIENGQLPTIDVPISLGNKEECYFEAQAEWHEQRTVTQRINYRGATVSIRIMKGVRYRAGSIKPQRITSEEYKLIDSGCLYLTNKRLIFMGGLKNSTINISKILSFTLYSDGVVISKETGRQPFLKFSDNSEMFSLIMSRLLNS